MYLKVVNYLKNREVVLFSKEIFMLFYDILYGDAFFRASFKEKMHIIGYFLLQLSIAFIFEITYIFDKSKLLLVFSTFCQVHCIICLIDNLQSEYFFYTSIVTFIIIACSIDTFCIIKTRALECAKKTLGQNFITRRFGLYPGTRLFGQLTRNVTLALGLGVVETGTRAMDEYAKQCSIDNINRAIDNTARVHEGDPRGGQRAVRDLEALRGRVIEDRSMGAISRAVESERFHTIVRTTVTTVSDWFRGKK